MSIPIHHVTPSGSNLHKTLIIFHGWGSSVENYRAFANEISELGYEVLLPEMLYHDSRGQLQNKYSTETIQTHFGEVIFQTLAEAPDIFSAASNPVEKITVMGVSMGGFIASGILGKHKEIEGLININGSGAFIISENLFRVESGREEMSLQERDALEKVDPMRQPIKDKAILCLHGDADSVVSVEGQRQFAEKFGPFNDLNYIEYPGVNHTITEEMSNDVLVWLKK